MRTVFTSAVACAVAFVLTGGAISAQQRGFGGNLSDGSELADALMGLIGALNPEKAGEYKEQREERDRQMDREILDMICREHPEMQVCKDRDKTPAPPPPSPPVQNEDVIPINGDSSEPVDEVMDGDEIAPEIVSGPFVPLIDPSAGMRQRANELLKTPLTVYGHFHQRVIQMRVLSAHGLSAAERRELTTTAGILAPVDAKEGRAIDELVTTLAPRGSGVHVTTLPLRAFCVESAKLPPAEGMVFRWAARAVQEQFAGARMVRTAAEFAARHGYLRPQGDAESYGRFVTQYAIWTKLEHWDQARFTNELVTRTRRDMAAAKKPWTSETEMTLRALAPARWRDTQLVIQAADIVETKQRTSGGTR